MRKVCLAVSAVLFGVCIFAADAPNEVGVRVTVRSASGDAVHDAYVSLIPVYRPWGRPLAERVADDGIALFRVPSGSYRVVAVASEFGSTGLGPITVSATSKNDIPVRLNPLRPISGLVTDGTGNPLAGARVYVGYAAGPAGLGNFSELHRHAVLDHWSAVSANDGTWTLAVPADTATPIVIEKNGYATIGRLYRPDHPEPFDIALRPAGSLHAVLDRTDAGLLVTLRRVDSAEPELPADWQAKVWGQWPLTSSLSWEGLAPGKYEIIAKYTDPRSFGQNYTRLQTVSLAAGERGETAVHLPPAAPPADKIVRLFLPNVTEDEVPHVQAFGLSPAGVPIGVPYSVETTTGGTVVYIDAEAAHAPFYATTSDRLISPLDVSGDALTDEVPRPGALHSIAAVNLHVQSGSPETPLPAGGIAVFNGCQHAPRVTVGIEILKDGIARLPAPAGCENAVLQFEPFEPVTVPVPIRAGATASLGNYTLQVGGGADIHVVRVSDGTATAVRDATVSVTIPVLKGAPVVITQATTGMDGWAKLAGLPARRDLRVVARTADGDTTLPARLRTEPRGRTVIDPLAMTVPATLIVEPRIDLDLRRRFPDATLESVRVQSTDLVSPEEHVAEVYGKDTVTLARLLPGEWQVMAVLKVAGTASPIYADPVQLTAGETRHVKLEVKPLVFTGRVVARGNGVRAMLYLGGVSGTPSVQRNVVTGSDGSFQIVLPSRGPYDVIVARMPEQNFAIPIGQVNFAEPAVPVEIALPEGRLTVHVLAGKKPAGDATVFASLRRDAPGGLDVLRTGTRTNAQGNAQLTLPAGHWMITASSDASNHSAEKVVNVSTDDDARVDLDLSDSTSSFSGTIHAASGAGVSGAAVECVLPDLNGVPSVATTASDNAGQFSFDGSPQATRARCGVTAPDGAIQTFMMRAGESEEVVLASNPGRLRVKWPATQRGALWLVSGDGGLVDLSFWISRSLGTRTFVIPALAPGEWRLLRVATVADWVNLAETGTATSLGSATVPAAGEKTIDVDSSSPD